MRIALISPRGSFFGKNEEFYDFWESSIDSKAYRDRWSGISSGLLIVAALTPPAYQIDFIDDNVDTIDFTARYDLVGISGTTQQAPRAYEIADEFRKKGITVVMGGIHATVLPQEAKEHSDSVVVGEAEHVWPILIDDFGKGLLKPYYRSERPIELKDSPIPRYDLLDKDKYRIFWVQTTRGCPHDCEFCAASKIYGSRYRTKGIAQVVKEIETIKRHVGDFRLYFADDNLFVNKRFYLPLLEKMAQLKMKWMAQTDIAVARNNELLEMLRRSGCIFLFIGLESLTEEGLRSIDKHGWKLKHLHRYSDYVQNIQQHGIGVQGAFIVGLDSDDPSVFDKVIEFVNANHLYGVQVTIVTPLPGTRLRERLERENRILSNDWGNYTGWDVNFVPKGMTAKQLERGLVTVYRAVTSREVFLKNMKYFKQIERNLLQKDLFG